MTDPQQDELIEGGATGEDLPLFVRREAARQAERLAADLVAHAAASLSRLLRRKVELSPLHPVSEQDVVGE